MKIEQLMTRDPMTVTPDTTLKDVAAILSSQGISGLPVVDGDRRVLGVVSEADILRKEQGLGGGRGGGVLGWLLDRDEHDPKLEARTAGEVVNRPLELRVDVDDSGHAADVRLDELRLRPRLDLAGQRHLAVRDRDRDALRVDPERAQQDVVADLALDLLVRPVKHAHEIGPRDDPDQPGIRHHR